MRWAGADWNVFTPSLRPEKVISGDNWSAMDYTQSYGFKTAPPGLTSSRIEVEKLQQFEDEAKREKFGARASMRAIEYPGTSPWLSVHSLPMESSLTLGTSTRLPFFSVARPSSVITCSKSGPASQSPRRTRFPAREHRHRRCDEKELTTMPGIGHLMAAHIIAARPFRSADDLKKVSGIGEKKSTQTRPYFQ